MDGIYGVAAKALAMIQRSGHVGDGDDLGGIGRAKENEFLKIAHSKY